MLSTHWLSTIIKISSTLKFLSAIEKNETEKGARELVGCNFCIEKSTNKVKKSTNKSTNKVICKDSWSENIKEVRTRSL